MRKIFSILILFLTTISGYSQKVEVQENGLFVNSINITSETSLVILEKILGKPDEIHLLGNTIWTYNKLGMLVYSYPVSGKIGSITVEFDNQGYAFSPTNLFSGSLTICGINVYGATPLKNLKKIKCLEFDEAPVYWHTATVSYLELFLHVLRDENNLKYLSISFKSRDVPE